MKKLILAELDRLLGQVRQADGDEQAWIVFRNSILKGMGNRGFPFWAFLCGEISSGYVVSDDDKVVRLSPKDRQILLDLLVRLGESEKRKAVLHLKECLSGAQTLTICDGYLLAKTEGLEPSEYVASLVDAFPGSLRRLELFVYPKKRDALIADELNRTCRANGIRIIVRKSKLIHDRVWIADYADAFVVGTSFNGLGSKHAFILQLPDEERRSFIAELSELRDSLPRSNSA